MIKYKEYAMSLVRYGLGIVFLLFGYDQIFNPSNWIAWFPQNLVNYIVYVGIFNLVVGLFLVLGLFTRVVALLAALHLIGVIVTIGYGEVAIRDFGLLLGAFAVLFYGADRLSLDLKYRKGF